MLGVGAIGSSFADALARAGHDVTAIARGARLAQLREDGAIVHSDGVRTPVGVAAELDPSIAYDLVLVTVLAPQVGAVLPVLARSAATRVMFMFNTFEPLDPLRDAVGPARFAFGFPGGVFTLLEGGRITRTIRAGTTFDRAEYAELFTAAGIPSTTTTDMHAWLRSHAALVAPLMALGVLVVARGSGATWKEARRFAGGACRGVRARAPARTRDRAGLRGRDGSATARGSHLPLLGDEPDEAGARSREARRDGAAHAHRPDGAPALLAIRPA